MLLLFKIRRGQIRLKGQISEEDAANDTLEVKGILGTNSLTIKYTKRTR